jgi:hypothetical protein
MDYKPIAAAAGHSTFENVFVNPGSYRSFLQSGTWPDKTMLMLEVRAAARATSINKNGHEAHAAVDTTFVQFHPTLLPVAKAKGTLSPAYLGDEKDTGAAQ